MISRGMPSRASASFSNAAGVERLVGAEMRLQVENGAGQVFDRVEALAESAGVEDLVRQRVGHRLTGAIVDGEARQQLRRRQPALIELAGQFDEIAHDGCPGQGAVGGA